MIKYDFPSTSNKALGSVPTTDARRLHCKFDKCMKLLTRIRVCVYVLCVSVPNKRKITYYIYKIHNRVAGAHWKTKIIPPSDSNIVLRTVKNKVSCRPRGFGTSEREEILLLLLYTRRNGS